MHSIQYVSSDLKSKILEAIKEEDCVQMIKNLVPVGQPDAEDPLDPDMPHGREEGISLHVAELLKEMGFDVQLPTGCEGRPNVVGTLKGSEGEPSLILNDHLDTYPAGDHKEWDKTNFDPYNPTVIGRLLYARGTSDTRANMACQLIALRTLLKLGVKFKGDLICAYTVDEERDGFSGSRFLLEEKGLKADYEITAEPTSWTRGDKKGIGIAIAHSGHCIIEVETKGTKSHIWRPDVGVNAISKMAKLIQALDNLEFTHQSPKIYGSTKPRVTIVKVQGGKKGETQFTPDRCRARVLVIGIVPGMTKEGILDDIKNVISRLKKEDENFNADVEIMKGYTFIPGTQEIPESSLHVQALMEAYQEVSGDKPELYRKHAFCDTIQFCLHDIPAVTFGPGEDGWPPVNEFVDLDKVILATKVYGLTIPKILGIQ